jgi:hypothetical protein
MTDQESPIGQLFTHAYTERGAPVQDSEIFRRRLGSYVDSHHSKDGPTIQQFLKLETGLKVPYFSNRGGGRNFEEFLVDIPIGNLLNIITLLHRFLSDMHQKHLRERHHMGPNPAEAWHSFVSRIFREENLGYTLDDECGVHFLVDEEFEHNRVTMLRSLDSPRYAGVRDAFEAAHRHLDIENQDTKAAVRSMFESLEILTRLMVDTKNLNAWVVEHSLKQLARDVYASDEIANAAMEKVFDGFAQWVDGLHHYRHGQGKPEPVSPSLGFAIYVVSSGASMLRLLVEIDTALSAEQVSA